VKPTNLRELDRMKDDFISTVTHELRTPLTSIRAFSEMLHQDPEIDLADRTRFLGIIVNEAERLTRLINQILDMAKLESGRAEWTTGDVDIGEVAREASVGQLFRDKPSLWMANSNAWPDRAGRPRPDDAGDDQLAVERREVRAGRQRAGSCPAFRGCGSCSRRGAGQRPRPDG
jgi:hypothetical protein